MKRAFSLFIIFSLYSLAVFSESNSSQQTKFMTLANIHYFSHGMSGLPVK